MLTGRGYPADGSGLLELGCVVIEGCYALDWAISSLKRVRGCESHCTDKDNKETGGMHVRMRCDGSWWAYGLGVGEKQCYLEY